MGQRLQFLYQSREECMFIMLIATWEGREKEKKGEESWGVGGTI